MVKVVYANLQTPKKRVRNAGGSRETVVVLNGDSPDFADDLTHAFARNVARARREHKRLFGSASGAPAKA